MKKQTVVIVMSAMMAVSAAGNAGAAENITKIGSMTGVNQISNSDYLKLEKNGGYALGTMEGQAITGYIYNWVFGYEYGYITVGEMSGDPLASWGVLTKEGKELIPFQYAVIEVLNSHWILGINLQETTADKYDYESTSYEEEDTYYLITTVDIYHVEDNTASLVTTLPREQYQDAEGFDRYINIQDRSTGVITAYDAQFNAVASDIPELYSASEELGERVIFKENGLMGVKDAQGNIIMEPSFQYVSEYEGDYARVSTGEKEGLIDYDGNVVVPAEYDSVKGSSFLPYHDNTGTNYGVNARGYYGVVLDGKAGFVDSTGTFSCPLKYSENVMETFGASGMLTDTEGNRIIVAGDGVETAIEGYSDITTMLHAAGMYYKVKNENGDCGMIDWHGNEILACQYGDIFISGSGDYAIATLGADMDIYKLSYEGMESGSTATGESTGTTETVVENAEAAEEMPETAGTDISAVTALLDSVIAILKVDAEGNRVAAANLLNSAAGMLGADQESVTVIVNSAVTILETAGSDAGSVVSLVENAKIMLEQND